MKLTAILTAIGASCLLTACAASDRSVVPPRLDPPPPSLTVACPPPVDLPTGSLTQREVERHWIRDRISLLECADRHAALSIYYQTRDRALAREGET